jgi:hypothetical protein
MAGVKRSSKTHQQWLNADDDGALMIGIWRGERASLSLRTSQYGVHHLSTTTNHSDHASPGATADLSGPLERDHKPTSLLPTFDSATNRTEYFEPLSPSTLHLLYSLANNNKNKIINIKLTAVCVCLIRPSPQSRTYPAVFHLVYPLYTSPDAHTQPSGNSNTVPGLVFSVGVSRADIPKRSLWSSQSTRHQSEQHVLTRVFVA